MRCTLSLICLSLILLSTVSCREDFEYRLSNGQLQFSKDTVFLDTIFTNIGSATYMLKVFNRSSDDILIPNIGLESGEGSGYRLNVDGKAGSMFNDVILLGRDSLFIFVETTFDISTVGDNTFLYTDAIIFDQGPREQRVALVTLVKDAHFLYPSRLPDGRLETLVLGKDSEGKDIEVPGFELSDEQLVFSNEKPYVIYGYAGVPMGKTLQIDSGARVHFHNESGLFVSSMATLNIAGELSEDPGSPEKEVFFEGDRLEAAFDDIPGQWGGVWLAAGSSGHMINHLILRNATTGIYLAGNPVVSEPTLHIKNSLILNSAQINLLATDTHLLGDNLVLGNAGFASLVCDSAGEYTLRHSTIANYWSQGGRTGPALLLKNTSPGSAVQTSTFLNTIIAGNTFRELGLLGEATRLEYYFSHSLISFEGSGSGLPDFSDPGKFNQILLNGKPDFINTAKQDFRLGPASEASGIGDPETAQLVPLDIQGVDRQINPDPGAYEQIP